MSTIILRPQTRAEWLRERMNGIGSSEVATILGLNPFETPYQLWRRKLGMDAPADETFAMKAGHYLEDAVAQFWHDETGREVIKSSAGDWIIRSDSQPHLQVSPDRTYWLDGHHSNDNKGILECKTTQMPVDADDLPKHWYCQVQYQLGVAELQQGSIAWLTQGREFGYKDIALVPTFFEWLKEEATRFYVDCVQGGKEPELANVKDVLIKYNRSTENKVIEVDKDIFDAYMRLKDVRKELAAIEERKETLENTIKLAFGDAEAVSFEGRTLATWKSAKASRKFDSKRFCSENPDIADKYMIDVEGSRRFLVK